MAREVARMLVLTAAFVLVLGLFPGIPQSRAALQSADLQGQAPPSSPSARFVPLASSPFARFAQRLLWTADSVLVVACQMESAVAGLDSGDGGTGEFGALLARGGARMGRLVDDFDAVVPPAELERVHDQLLAPLRRSASALSRAGALYQVSCNAEWAAGLTCDINMRLLIAGRAARIELSAAAGGLLAYRQARERAARMLIPYRLTLPPLIAAARC